MIIYYYYKGNKKRKEIISKYDCDKIAVNMEKDISYFTGFVRSMNNKYLNHLY